MITSHAPMLIFLAAFLPAFLIPITGRIRPVLPMHTAAAGLVLATLLSLAGLLTVSGGEIIRYHLGGWQPPVGIEWRLDALNAVIALVICLIALLVVFATLKPVREEIGGVRQSFYISVLLLVSALLGITFTYDLFNLFVFLEVSSLAGYALIAVGDSRRASYASLRYLLLGSIGAAFYLLGVGYLYAATGTLNMSDMAVRLRDISPDVRTVPMGVLLIFLGLAIKMGLFPFHGWLPEAYTYASNPVSSLIAPVMTKVAVYAVIRLSFWVFGLPLLDYFHLFTMVKWLGIFGIAVGSLFAFTQTNLKRMLAYSSVSHIGLIAVGFGLQNIPALTGAVLHIVAHAVMKACLFLGVTALFTRHKVLHVSDLHLLSGKMPWTFAFLCIAALSMIGVPPLAGFFSKWYILIGAWHAGDPLTAGVIVFSSLLTALYFFRIIEQIFFSHPGKKEKKTPAAGASEDVVAALLEDEKQPDPEPEAPRRLIWILGFLAAGLLLLGLTAPWIYSWAAQTLFRGTGL